MNLIKINDAIINLETITIARLETEDEEHVLFMGFMDDGSTAKFYGAEAIVLWQYLSDRCSEKINTAKSDKLG